MDDAVAALARVSADGAPVAEDHIVRVPIDGGGAITQAVRELDDAGVRIDDVAVRRPTLDDVFMTLTGKPPEPETDNDVPPASSASPPGAAGSGDAREYEEVR